MYKWQDEFLNDISHKMYFLVAANQTGKMEANNKLIPTPIGYREIGHLRVGDYVFGQDGKRKKVLAIPYEGVRPFYRITFDDGSTTECGREHLWKVQTEKNRFRPTYTCGRGKKKGDIIPNKKYGKWEVLETHEIIKLGGYEDSVIPRPGKKVAIPVCDPVEYSESNLDVSPYVMGAMIGDGDCKNNRFGSGDIEITKRVASEFNSKISTDERKSSYTYCGRIKLDGYSCTAIDKYIPDEYKYGSIEQRLELLKGLMDTDGSIYGKNTLEYCTISERLKDDFIELINSLGGLVGRLRKKKAYYYNGNREKKYCNDAYSIVFKIQFNPFWIARKASKWRRDIRYKHQRLIEKIEPIGDIEGRCISVEDEMYLTGKEFIVTHNSTIQIRKRIHIATSPDLWPRLWPRSFKVNPRTKPMSWYLYPNQTTTLDEFYEKWVNTLLPKDEYKDHPVYGWKAEVRNKILKSITFNTGYTIYFKTYNQNVSDMQAGTAFAIDCFTSGHKVITSNGITKVEDISTGDYALTRSGDYKPVVKTYKRKAKAVVRYLSDGTRLEATKQHMVWTTNNGYIPFFKLTCKDVLDRVSEKEILWTRYKQHITGKSITGILSLTTLGFITFKDMRELMVRSKSSFSIEMFMNMKAALVYLLAIIYIIPMRTYSIIRFLTWICSANQNTQDYTRKKHGQMDLLESGEKKYVRPVESSLKQGQRKRRQLGIALRSVGKNLMLRLGHASAAVKCLALGRTALDASVLPYVGEPKNKYVYNINVSGEHNYRVSGISVKNCDEELPYNLFPELSARLFATDGQFSMAFTATLGQEEWRQAMEIGGRDETFKDAWKRTISMYDCLKYSDGSDTEWTVERIKQKEAMCASRAEVRRRVYGEFVKIEGLKYSGFDRSRNLVKFPRGHNGQEFRGVPKGWMVYSGVDIGSGGKTGHPSAYTFISVNPDFNKIRVFRCRRLDKIETTAGDTLKHYVHDRGKLMPVMQCYDWASKDFGTIAERSGEYFVKAEKSHAIGEQVLNAAFKSGMLKIYDDGVEARKLAYELETLGHDTDKRASKDDLIDSLRYAITRVPIDWKTILDVDTSDKSVKINKDKRVAMLEEHRPSGNWNESGFEEEDWSDEIEEWNSMY